MFVSYASVLMHVCSNCTLPNKGAHDVLIKAVPKLTRFDE